MNFPEKCQKAHSVLQFGTICLIIKHKNTCAGTLIFVKFPGWSASSLKLTFLPKCTLPQIQNKTHFQVDLVCFSQAS